ncbi:hypothetical protein HK099_006393 [Clydaea vesicula]|uniref:SH3 domain-containing protein n=1 Tax=Clydaea vesicula TaxID=447962 RepID=A0AAD5TY94_9FUNG|nr:hypothetical protein HK099_006393 [Clydaea vesicula]
MSFLSGTYSSTPAICQTPPMFSCFDFCTNNIKLEFNENIAILTPLKNSGTSCDISEFCEVQTFVFNKNDNNYFRRYNNVAAHGSNQTIQYQDGLLRSINRYPDTTGWVGGSCYSTLTAISLSEPPPKPSSSPLENTRDTGTNINIYIGLAIGLFLLLLFGLGSFYFFYRKRKNSESVLKEEQSNGNSSKVEGINLYPLLTNYVAIASYQPVLDDELEVLTGDHITIHSVHSDGWCTGVNERTGHTGQVAMNLLQPI